MPPLDGAGVLAGLSKGARRFYDNLQRIPYVSIRPDGLYSSQMRFGLYRWHIMDPIRFEKDLRVTIQDLGWIDATQYEVRRDDLASVAFWYQTTPHQPFPPLPGVKSLLVD